jgi:hypothetical protein
MNKKYNDYISGLQLKDFQIILEEFDIYLDEEQQTKILSMIQNNQYALIHEQYQFVLENYIKKLTSDFTCQKVMLLLNHYFKPLLNV